MKERSEGLPPLSLRPMVGTYVGYHSTGRSPGVHRALPSTRLLVTLAFEQPLRLSWAEGTDAPVEHAMVAAGMRLRAVLVHHGGGHHGLQFSLSPSGCRTLFGVPAAVLAHQYVELGELMNLDQAALTDATWSERFGMIDRVLLRGAAAVRPAPVWTPELDRVWLLLRRTGGTVRVRDCATEVGWSRRRLLDRFKGEFGITPKEAARVCRFEASRKRLREGESLAGTAFRCGYADQSHLSREWRALAGCSPARWMRSDGDSEAALDPGLVHAFAR